MILNELLQRQRKNNEAQIHLHRPSPAAHGASCKSKQALFKRCKEITKNSANLLTSITWRDLNYITYRTHETKSYCHAAFSRREQIQNGWGRETKKTYFSYTKVCVYEKSMYNEMIFVEDFLIAFLQKSEF